MSRVTDALIIHVEYDHLRHPTYRFTFPLGPFVINTWGWTLDELRRAGMTVRDHSITVAGRKFLTVTSDRMDLSPAIICYPISDPWTYVRLAHYCVSRYFLPLRRWIAWQFHFAGWLRQGDAFSLSRLLRRLLDETISGPADPKVAKAAEPPRTSPTVVPSARTTSFRDVILGEDHHYVVRAQENREDPIHGADDARVEAAILFDPALPIDEARWADYNRKFNALLRERSERAT